MTTKISAKDLLQNLTKGKKPTKTAEAKSRPEIELTEDLKQSCRTFAGIKELFDVVEKSLDQEKETVDDGCFKEWLNRLWQNRTQPANPSVKVGKVGNESVVDVTLNFLVQSRYVFNLPEVKEGQEASEVTATALATCWEKLGMAKQEAAEKAVKLVTTELDFTPKTTLDFNKLVNGHYEGVGKNKTFVEATEQEQLLASKVLDLFSCRSKQQLAQVDPLTDEEASQILETKYSVVVKPGFLQRVCSYVNTLEQLSVVFMFVRPVKYPAQVKYAVSDTPEEKNKRLAGVAMELLGVS